MDDEARWAAIAARASEYDGRFVYGVRTTGIFCRPSCPARRPRREHVAFFADATAARAVGLRPCRRCQPERDGDPQTAVVAEVCRLIEARLPGALTLAELGAAVGFSPFHMQRVFRRVTGVTPRQFAAARRLEQFKTAVRDGDSVTAALYAVGYGSSSRLYEHATARLGMTPGGYRRRGAALTIGYTIVPMALGRLLVAATERGVCMVSLGDDEGRLITALRAEYPAATVTRDDAAAAPYATAILRGLAGAGTCQDLPLDIQGTAFQWRVWEALRTIPAGETRSYAAVAAAIGAPQAARAVARACAANPACLVIPCHRVTHADGTLSGYRWGAARKAALLAGERGAAATSPDDGIRETANGEALSTAPDSAGVPTR